MPIVFCEDVHYVRRDFELWGVGLPKLLYVFTLICLLLLTSTGLVSAQEASTTPTSLQTTYLSFGDSITVGAGLKPGESYSSLIAADLGFILNNRAVSGYTACQMAHTQVFSQTTPPAHLFQTMMIGTNDSNVEGAGAYEAVFNMCHLAAMTWLATPPELKMNAQNCRRGGDWSVEPSLPVAELTSRTRGSELICDFDTNSTSVYLWFGVNDRSTGVFQFSLDSAPPRAIQVRAAVPMRTKDGRGGLGASVVRLQGVPLGHHQLKIVIVSPTGPESAVTIYGVGSPQGDASQNKPTLFVGGVPYQRLDLHGRDSDVYNSLVKQNVLSLARDGLDIRFVNVRQFLKGESSLMLDDLHPNADGQIALKNAFEAAAAQGYTSAL